MTAGEQSRDEETGPDWAVSLRRQPASVPDSQPEGRRPDAFELICRDCGDDPALDYREVSPGLQHTRGPYSLTAGIRALLGHDRTCHPPAPPRPP